MTQTKEEKSLYQRKWYLEHKEHHNIISERARLLRIDESLEYHRKHYREHKEYYKEKRRLWWIEHPGENKKFQVVYRKLHPDRISAYHKKYSQDNPEVICAISRRRRARKLLATGNGITAKQAILLKEETGGRCVYCGNKKKLTIDHVEPLVAGGRDDIDNAVPACQSCNSSKGTKNLLMYLYSRNTYD
jgi:5-methylcytosine-specific restriction endonuclease McrA